MDPWNALLARAAAERELAAQGRWEELAASTAERVRLTAALGPAPRQARLVLEALAAVQDELTTTLRKARAETARELAELGRGRGAVAGYASAQAAPQRRWVNDAA
jgi:Flagellar protein FliT